MTKSDGQDKRSKMDSASSSNFASEGATNNEGPAGEASDGSALSPSQAPAPESQAPVSQAAPAAEKALTSSRFFDFWLIGGGSIVAWIVMWLAEPYRGWFGLQRHFADSAATFASLALVVNYPHFLAGYRLAYTRGTGFIKRYWFQTMVVPVALLAVMIYAYVLLNEPGSQTSANQGEQVLAGLVNLMYLTVGWHYTKQAFGVTMVYANYDRYPLDNVQRNLIRYSLLSVWWYSFAANSVINSGGKYWELAYQSWGLPRGGIQLTGFITLALVTGVIYRVLLQNWRKGFAPSVNLVTPYLALLFWFLPFLRQTEYFLYFVPFFHSLQYLLFVYRVERSLPSEAESETQWTLVMFGLVAAGWLLFEFLPGNLDVWLDHVRTFGLSFFLICASLLLNIHHYFLDNVLWRLKDDAVVRKALLS